MASGIWIVITPVALLIGIGIGFWIGKLQQGGTEERLGEVQKEFDDYKSKVTEHFSQSAAHFNSIGQQYRELYEHMANGSKNLCLADDSEHKFPAPEMVAAVSHSAAASAEPEAELEVIEAEATAEDIESVADAPELDTAADTPADDIEETEGEAVQAAEESAEPEATDGAADDVEKKAGSENTDVVDDEPPIASDDEKEPRLYH